MSIPIICYTGGHRFSVPRVTADLRCACGSTDLDLDEGPAPRRSRRTADYNDPEMAEVKEVPSVAQSVTCSNCLTDHTVTVVDPAQPMPACPHCGEDTLSAAGGTLARRRTAANEKMSNSDYAAGYLSGTQDAGRRKFDLQNNPESSNSDFAEGYYAGFDGWTTGRRKASRRTAGEMPYVTTYTPGSPCPYCDGKDVEQTVKAGSPLSGVDRYKCSSCLGEMSDSSSWKTSSRRTASEGEICYNCTPEGSGKDSYGGECPYCRGTGVDSTPFGTGGDHCPWCGSDWKQPHAEDCESPYNRTSSLNADFARLEASLAKTEKVAEIARGIRETNPSIPLAEARRIATKTVSQYPGVVGGR